MKNRDYNVVGIFLIVLLLAFMLAAFTIYRVFPSVV